MLTLTGHCLYDLPSDILEHIFQFFKVQDCLNIVAHVCRRFYNIVNDSGALWRSLKTDAEFDVDSFELVIVNHAKHFCDLALLFSQKRVRYNSPSMHIENTIALCEKLRHLNLSYNTSITTIEFIGEINCLTSLILTGCTSIEPNNTMNCLKYNGSCLKVLNISHCQFGDEHIASLIDVVVKNLTSLEIFHAESTALFSIDNAREILETRDLKELALSPNWGPPPIWADFLEEYQHVKFGEHFKSHLERINLTNFLYSDEEEDL